MFWKCCLILQLYPFLWKSLFGVHGGNLISYKHCKKIKLNFQTIFQLFVSINRNRISLCFMFRCFSVQLCKNRKKYMSFICIHIFQQIQNGLKRTIWGETFLKYSLDRYRPFHKTLPKSSAFINKISVRFYETDCI